MRKTVWIACALAAMTVPASASDSGFVTTFVARVRNTNMQQPIVVSPHPTVFVSQTTIAPGARTPSHKHPYPRYVYVIEGTLTVVDEETGKTFTNKSGEFLPEMIDRWHHGENHGTTPVRLVTIDQVPEGVTNNMLMK